MEREITKQEFQKLYVKYGQSQKDSGWTQGYWDEFYEPQTGVRYFFTEPTSPDETRMFINSGGNTERIFLMTEDAEESFFEHPDW